MTTVMWATAPVTSEDLVPLAERARYMRLARVALVALVALAWLGLPAAHALAPDLLGGVSAAYLAVALGADLAWRHGERRALTLFAAVLMLDAVYLVWLGWVLDGGELLRALALLHLVTATLLASFRTGVKLALWYALLLVAVYHAREAGVLGEPLPFGGEEYREVVATACVALLAALVTSGFSAVNERELRRRRYDLEALGALALRLEATTRSDQIAKALVDAVADDFGFPRAVLVGFLKRDVLAAVGVEVPEGTTLPDGRVLPRAAQGHEPLLVSGVDPEREPGLAALLPGAENLVLVPLHAERRTVAVLVCEHGFRRGGRIERRVTTMLSRYASQSAFALAGAWLLEQVEHSATIDALTTVANRRAFDDGLAAAAARAGRSEEPLSLVLLDIDHFKALNDTHGHVAGDTALRAVAQALARDARGGDLVARYGGEEFAVVLPGVEGDAAFEAAERLRRAASAGSTTVPVTLSAGVATLGPHAPDPLSLIQTADAALYAAKEGGRDRTMVGAAGASHRRAG